MAAARRERLDGGGYPRGDIFDVITAERSYRGAIPMPRMLEMMGAIDAACFAALRSAPARRSPGSCKMPFSTEYHQKHRISRTVSLGLKKYMAEYISAQMAYAGMPKITLDALNTPVAFAPMASPSALALSLVMIAAIAPPPVSSITTSVLTAPACMREMTPHS